MTDVVKNYIGPKYTALARDAYYRFTDDAAWPFERCKFEVEGAQIPKLRCSTTHALGHTDMLHAISAKTGIEFDAEMRCVCKRSAHMCKNVFCNKAIFTTMAWPKDTKQNAKRVVVKCVPQRHILANLSLGCTGEGVTEALTLCLLEKVCRQKSLEIICPRLIAAATFDLCGTCNCIDKNNKRIVRECVVLVLEQLDGCDLQDFLARHKQSPSKDAIDTKLERALQKTFEAVAQVQEEVDWSHGDLHAKNVWVSKQKTGDLKIQFIDFGQSSFLVNVTKPHEQTKTVRIAGGPFASVFNISYSNDIYKLFLFIIGAQETSAFMLQILSQTKTPWIYDIFLALTQSALGDPQRLFPRTLEGLQDMYAIHGLRIDLSGMSMRVVQSKEWFKLVYFPMLLGLGPVPSMTTKKKRVWNSTASDTCAKKRRLATNERGADGQTHLTRFVVNKCRTNTVEVDEQMLFDLVNGDSFFGNIRSALQKLATKTFYGFFKRAVFDTKRETKYGCYANFQNIHKERVCMFLLVYFQMICKASYFTALRIKKRNFCNPNAFVDAICCVILGACHDKTGEVYYSWQMGFETANYRDLQTILKQYPTFESDIWNILSSEVPVEVGFVAQMRPYSFEEVDVIKLLNESIKFEYYTSHKPPLEHWQKIRRAICK